MEYQRVVVQPVQDTVLVTVQPSALPVHAQCMPNAPPVHAQCIGCQHGGYQHNLSTQYPNNINANCMQIDTINQFYGLIVGG